MSVSYSQIKSASGTDVGIAIIARDVTDRIRYESQIAGYNAQLKSQMAELEKANKALEALSTTDGLTGLLNHRAFQERLAEEFQRSHRYGHDMSLVMLDVDNFKQFNDMFGHPAGDAVLRRVSRIAAETARASDITARYGGEEFAVILTETNSDSAVAFAERLPEQFKTLNGTSAASQSASESAVLHSASPIRHKWWSPPIKPFTSPNAVDATALRTFRH